MFFKINNKNVVNLNEVAYVALEQNQMGLFEVRIFLKNVEHYMFVQYIEEEEAQEVFEALANRLLA